MDGLAFLKQVHEKWPELPVILMTAYGSLETTMEALRLGAWDYISKPFSPEAIRAMVQKVLDVRDLQQHGSGASRRIGGTAVYRLFGDHGGFLQADRPGGRCLGECPDRGESGTGKELTARSLHQLSARRR